MTTLRDLMRNFLPANKYNDAIGLLGQLVRNDENEDENVVLPLQIIQQSDNSVGTKRKRKEGTDDLPEKYQFKDLKVPIEKLNYIFHLHRLWLTRVE